MVLKLKLLDIMAILEGNYWILRIGLMGSRQKYQNLTQIWLSKSFFYVKKYPNLSKKTFNEEWRSFSVKSRPFRKTTFLLSLIIFWLSKMETNWFYQMRDLTRYLRGQTVAVFSVITSAWYMNILAIFSFCFCGAPGLVKF